MAKGVGNLFNDGIYDTHIELKNQPVTALSNGSLSPALSYTTRKQVLEEEQPLQRRSLTAHSNGSLRRLPSLERLSLTGARGAAGGVRVRDANVAPYERPPRRWVLFLGGGGGGVGGELVL